MAKRKWPWQGKGDTDERFDDAPTYIIETHQRQDIGKVEGIVADYLQHGWNIAPLFDNAPDESIRGQFNLACFWQLRLPGPPFREWEESPYDLAYELEERTSARSIEPDLSSSLGASDSSSGWFSCEEPEHLRPADRAWALRSILAPEAWNYLKVRGLSEGRDILIAQPDTGFADHVELDYCIELANSLNLVEPGTLPKDPLLFGKPLGNPGHGTAVASVAVSRGGVLPTSTPPDHGTSAPGRITGVSRDAQLVPIRAIRSVMRVTQGKVAKAVQHARAKGMHVISMSLGGFPSRGLEAAILDAVSAQLIVVCAAGNCVRVVVYPGRYPTVICLGGSNENLKPWKGSSRGKRVDICAPAEHVWRAQRTKPGEPHDLINGGQGTSFATAMTAGVAALWLNDRRPALIGSLSAGDTLQEVFRRCLKSTAQVPPGWLTRKFGAGIVDAHRLLQSECGSGAMPPSPPHQRVSYAQQVDDTLEEIGESQAPIPASPLANRIGKLPAAAREKFGHEVLVLLSQQAASGTGSTDLPVLQPSARLREILRAAGG